MKARDKLTKARIDLIAKYPFWGTLALRLDLKEMPPELRAWFMKNGLIPSLAVDGRTIWYAPDYVERLEYQHVISGIAHEVGHCIYDHMGRRGSRHQQKWLRATDYVVNGMLKRSGFALKDGWLYDPKYSDHTNAEQVYNELPDDPADESGGGKGQPPQDYVLDATHSEDPSLSHDWEVAVQQAAFAAKQAGKLPADLERFVSELAAPKVDWRTRLRRFVTERSKNDYSWMRPNKFYLPQGIILPGLYSENMGTLVSTVDDSGSIYPKLLNMFGSEINSIHASTRPKKHYLISCDMRVNNVDEFDEFDNFDMTKVKLHGGGGTDFRPPFKWLNEHNVQPACMIYLTDGYGPFPDRPAPFPVLWCMTTDVIPPWGEHVKIQLD